MAAMSQIQLAEWEWPQAPRFLMCTPLSHAGAAFFLPVLMAGGSMVVLPRFDPGEVLRTIAEQQDHLDDAGAEHDLRAARPPRLADAAT